MFELAILGAVVAGVSLLRGRIVDWPVTSPMLFIGAGILLGPGVLDIFAPDIADESISLTAELTLALLLFSDAARIDTTSLRTSYALPARLLTIGLPLTIGLGTVVTALVLTDVSWAEAALLGAILAPTDAALGRAVVSNEKVPVLIRQSLNVESGLNDGLVVPVVAVFALIVGGDEAEGFGTLVLEAFVEVGLGVAIGSAVGAALGWTTTRALVGGWTNSEGVRLVVFGGAIAGFAIAEVAGGNGFIAAFVAGLALHIVTKDQACDRSELAEEVGEIGAASTLFIFGALLIVPALEVFSFRVALYALLTLTVVRMLPVYIATIGSKLRLPSRLFLGWFGPRGLASMLFGLLIVAERGDAVDGVFAVVTFVHLVSVVLHGLSAGPGAERFGAWFNEQCDGDSCESMEMPELRLRGNRSE